MAEVTRPYHHGNLRRALLDRAEVALEEAGAQALSLRELARDVGVSHAAPRRHFPDKQALLVALAESGFARLGEALDGAIAGAGPGFDARLTAMAQAYVRFATRHAALLEVMFAAKHRPDAGARLRDAAERAFAAPLGLVEAGQAAGDVVAGDRDRVAAITWAMLHGIAGMANAGMLAGVPVDDLVAEAVERLVHGLRPRGPASAISAAPGG